MRAYTQIDNYTILTITQADEVVGFTVGDRNRERVTDKSFKVASDAIEWAEKFYVELVK